MKSFKYDDFNNHEYSQSNDIIFNEKKFFFFGCWNKGSCINNEYLNGVINDIKTKSNEYAFGIIAGDNVYPDRKIIGEKLISEYNDSTLINGIKCAKSIGKPLYVVLGNHDVDKCSFVDLHKMANDNLWIFPSNYYNRIIKLNGKILNFIFIDTNLFSNGIPCYDTDKNFNRQNEMDKMLKWIEGKINVKSDYIIIIGHEPLVSCEIKGRITQFILNEMFDRLMSLLVNKTIYYLCADTHNFQHIVINSKNNSTNMEIVIAGTGGAHPDFIHNKKEFGDKCSNFIKNGYNINILEYDNSYGFCEAEIVNDKIKFTYIKYKSDKLQGGQSNVNYRKKYIKYKKKYLALK